MSDIDSLLSDGHEDRRQDRPLDAHRKFAEAVSRGRRLGDPDQLARALKALGQIERDLGRADVALTLYEEALELCRSREESLATAHTVRHVGDIHRGEGRVEEAERCYREAVELYRAGEGASPADLANALRPLALLLESEGDPEEARTLWEEAVELYRAAGIEAGVAEGSERLAALAD